MEITLSSAPVCFLPGGGTWKGRSACTKEQLQGQQSPAGWFWAVAVAVGAGTSPGAPARVSPGGRREAYPGGPSNWRGVLPGRASGGSPARPEDDRTARTNIPHKVKCGQWGPVSGCCLEVHGRSPFQPIPAPVHRRGETTSTLTAPLHDYKRPAGSSFSG